MRSAWPPAWWGTRIEVSPRLRQEVEAMRTAFGYTFKLYVPNLDPLYWQGTVTLNLREIPIREHVVRIIYPHDYPDRPPEAYILKPKIFSEKHQFVDGQLCLFNPRDGADYGWNPARSTAVTVAGWSIEWLYAYYTWRLTNRWPGIEEHA